MHTGCLLEALDSALLTLEEDAEVRWVRMALVALLSRADAADHGVAVACVVAEALHPQRSPERLQQLHLPEGAGSWLAAGFLPAYATFIGKAPACTKSCHLCVLLRAVPQGCPAACTPAGGPAASPASWPL